MLKKLGKTLIVAFLLLPVRLSAVETITYWEKWNGVDAAPMQAMVTAYNASQNSYHVQYQAVSDIEQKTMLAVVSGDGPDLVGLYDHSVVPLASKGVLEPLGSDLTAAGWKLADYLPVFQDMQTYRGQVYGVISTPSVTSVYVNRRMLRQAGIDPTLPARNLAELVSIGQKLDRQGPQGEITQIGFNPLNYWIWSWVPWFGGSWTDQQGLPTASRSQNIAAFSWLQRQTDRIGPARLQRFRAPFLNGGEGADAFIQQKEALMLQGAWYPAVLERWGKGLDWGQWPCPPVRSGDGNPTLAVADVICVPRNARHKTAAVDFLAWISRPEHLEALNRRAGRFSPLRQRSGRELGPREAFFRDLASSPSAFIQARVDYWDAYQKEIWAGYDKLWLGGQSPELVLDSIQRSVERAAKVGRDATKAWRGSLRWTWLALVGAAVVAWIVRAKRAPKHASGRSPYWLLPGWLGLVVFIFVPVLAVLAFSLTLYGFMDPPRWLGASNFMQLGGDAVFWKAVWVTFVYAILSLPLGLLASLTCALLVQSGLRGSRALLLLALLPGAVPPVAYAIVWQHILRPDGPVNGLLAMLYGDHIRSWVFLGDTRFALFSLVGISVWSLGQPTLLLVAGLERVQHSTYEAAEMDGADGWQKLFYLSLPHARPLIRLNLLMGLLGCLQVFTVPYVMTGGGPARSTYFYAMYLWDTAFAQLRAGYASAMACILLLLILLLGMMLKRTNILFEERVKP